MSIDYKNLRACWLSPAGKVVPLPEQPYGTLESHIYIAGKILDEENPENFISDCTDALEEKGWIRLGEQYPYGNIWILRSFRKPTKRQEVVMVDWCNANEVLWEKGVLQYNY